MKQSLYILLLVGVSAGLIIVAGAERSEKQENAANGIRKQYEGNCVCQTLLPGYNLVMPHEGTVTTPSSVAIIKFTLKHDGTYETPSAKGH